MPSHTGLLPRINAARQAALPLVLVHQVRFAADQTDRSFRPLCIAKTAMRAAENAAYMDLYGGAFRSRDRLVRKRLADAEAALIEAGALNS